LISSIAPPHFVAVKQATLNLATPLRRPRGDEVGRAKDVKTRMVAQFGGHAGIRWTWCGGVLLVTAGQRFGAFQCRRGLAGRLHEGDERVRPQRLEFLAAGRATGDVLVEQFLLSGIESPQAVGFELFGTRMVVFDLRHEELLAQAG